MSAVCVLTPLVVASWPAVAAAVSAAAASMGFSLAAPRARRESVSPERTVETAIENSAVVADNLARGQKIVVHKDDVTVEIGLDDRNRCTVCVTGTRHSDLQLRRIGEQVAGRIVQQFVYHKLLTELKTRRYSVVGEEVLADQSIKVRVRL